MLIRRSPLIEVIDSSIFLSTIRGLYYFLLKWSCFECVFEKIILLNRKSAVQLHFWILGLVFRYVALSGYAKFIAKQFFLIQSNAKLLPCVDCKKIVSGVFNILNSVLRILSHATKLVKWRNERFLFISTVHDANKMQLCSQMWKFSQLSYWASIFVF